MCYNPCPPGEPPTSFSFFRKIDCMKNFLRALRCAWPYRRRLFLSVGCALLAAVFWSLNINSIRPVLEILARDKSLQDVLEETIQQTQAQIDEWNTECEKYRQENKRLLGLPNTPTREKVLRDTTNAIAGLESRLDSATSRLYWYRIAKWRLLTLLPTDRFETLACIIGLIVLAVAIKGFFEFWQDSLVGSVVNLSLFDLRNRFYRNVIHLDVNNFSEEGTHELMARFTNDMELLGHGMKTLFGKVVAEPLKALACVIWACFISWQLTLMFLVLVPIALFILTKVGRIMKRATRRLLERISMIYKILQETFQGIRVVKAFTMEPYERRRFCSATKDYYYKAMWVVNLDALASPVIELLGVAAVAAALLAGSYLVLRGETDLWGIHMTDQPLTYIELLQLYVSLAAIADPVRKLSSVYTRIQSGAAAADRIFNFLDRRPRVLSNSDSPRLAPHEAGIEFRDICFSYEPGRSVLTNVHLKVGAGEVVALVGKNGCGKTTLVGLLPRFYDPDHGSILIDGVNIRHVNLRSLRQQIGIVTQETILFDDTIYNNIAYGNRRARPEDIEAAAQRAFAHDFIVKLTQGYQTRVGEAGAKLSGGQKQRIALARAILRDPRILILDEFTSQSDAESEALIHRALKEFMRNRTTFVITHRLNTLEIADRIVVLDNGRVEAVGTHAELLKSCTVYQRLHDAHFQRLCA
jgi:ATP-binding cassette subfamily B protein/subfamily B ATP-binding cassette protein MsbA